MNLLAEDRSGYCYQFKKKTPPRRRNVSAAAHSFCRPTTQVSRD